MAELVVSRQHITKLLKRAGFIESTYAEGRGWSRGISLYCDGNTVDVEAWEYDNRDNHEKDIEVIALMLTQAFYTVERLPCQEGTYLVVSKNKYFERHSRLKQAA